MPQSVTTLGDVIGADNRTYPIAFLHVMWSKDERSAVGGILVTDNFGVPLEFRISTAVRASKLQVLLLGASLRGHFSRDIIGEKLIRNLTNRPLVYFVQQPELLSLPAFSETPAFSMRASGKADESPIVTPPDSKPQYASLLDLRTIHADMLEVFTRIDKGRQALSERDEHYRL